MTTIQRTVARQFGKVRDTLPRRDNPLWLICLICAIVSHLSTRTHLLPVAWVERVKDIADIVGYTAALFAASPLGPGRMRDIEQDSEDEA